MHISSFTHLQTPLSRKERLLHSRYGVSGIAMVRGAGRVDHPDVMLVFMNPTARNCSSRLEWKGLRAPWIGTKHIWGMLARAGYIDTQWGDIIDDMLPSAWTEDFAFSLYSHVADRSLFITNLASCTQSDARPLSNGMFRGYLPIIESDIEMLRPKHIITFGNQVSSILLKRAVSVSDYGVADGEELCVGGVCCPLYPTHYPVGQGMRNMPKTIERLRRLQSYNS